MTEETTPAAVEQPTTPTPEAPAVTEPAAQNETAPAEAVTTPEAPKPEEPAPAPKTEAPKVKITVTDRPKKAGKTYREGSFPPNDAAAKKAWIANKHKEQQDQLIKNGYTPSATLAIMRYLTSNHGYEKQRAKDHLIYMFERLARSLKYSLDRFDRDMSSLLAIHLIDINGHLNENKHLFDIPDEESMKFVQDVFNKVWKTDGGNSAGREMQNLKLHFLKSMNVKVVEGYARRCKYFLECIIDINMKMSDPFEGMFHTERLEIPDEMREIMHMKPKGQRPPKKEWPKVFCEKCGQEMRWVFPLHKHVCNNPLCTEYSPKPEYKGRGKGRPQGEGGERRPQKFNRQHADGYDSGKPIAQESGADRFKKRYARKPLTPEQEAKRAERKAVHAEMNRMSAEADKFAQAANPFAALDKLKVPTAEATPDVAQAAPAPETPAPAAEAQPNLPPPPAEQPVV